MGEDNVHVCARESTASSSSLRSLKAINVCRRFFMPSLSRSSATSVAPAMTPSAKALLARQDIKSAAMGGAETPATAEGASVAVIDDDERVRKALAFQLNAAGFQVVSYSSAREFLDTKDAGNLDCVVADILMPRMNGLQLQKQLKETGNFVSIVFITGRPDLSIGMQAMRAGAVDVLEKPVDDEVLLTAIERGVQHSRAGFTENSRRLDLEIRFNSLTPRQREVFALITAGFLNKQVAADLRISERTVKVHRERLRRKMGVDSLAELSRMAELLRVRPLSA
jgi:FixJ family two-component response regulator